MVLRLDEDVEAQRRFEERRVREGEAFLAVGREPEPDQSVGG
jgi:hypothetical protein